jgi:hypothetical protein
MNISIKKSHCFSFAVTAGVTFGFWASQFSLVASGAMAWSEVPALLVLQFLVSALVGISFDLAWQFFAKQAFRTTPEVYKPRLFTLVGVAGIVAALTITAGAVAPLATF